MIDFACKQFDLNEVIRCGLGLSKAEFLILKFYLTNKHSFFKTSQVSKNLGLELSTVQRATKKLYSLEILQRAQTNLSSGGYVFNYKIKDRKLIKEKILSVINSWNKRVEEELNSW